MDKQDYYEVLGVARSADAKKIKSAYRKLARQYHPDVNPGDQTAEARFKEIQEAYDVLSDDKKRKLYDQFGHQGVSANFDPEAAERMRRQWGRGGGFPGGQGVPPGFEEIFGATGRGGAGGVHFEGGGLGDLFGSIFSGGRRQAGPRPGRDLTTSVEIGFREALLGTEVRLRIDGGEGRPSNLTVKIPPGVKTGTRVRVPGKGSSGAMGGAAGDLYVETVVRDDPLFSREDDDLRCEIPVTLSEAALGASIEVPTIDGSVKLKIPAGTQGGRRFRLKGKGAPRLKGGGRGDLYVRVRIVVPKGLDDEEREMIERLAGKEPKNPRRGIS